jgi:ribosomal protein S27AE
LLGFPPILLLLRWLCSDSASLGGRPFSDRYHCELCHTTLSGCPFSDRYHCVLCHTTLSGCPFSDRYHCELCHTTLRQNFRSDCILTMNHTTLKAKPFDRKEWERDLRTISSIPVGPSWVALFGTYVLLPTAIVTGCVVGYRRMKYMSL